MLIQNIVKRLAKVLLLSVKTKIFYLFVGKN